LNKTTLATQALPDGEAAALTRIAVELDHFDVMIPGRDPWRDDFVPEIAGLQLPGATEEHTQHESVYGFHPVSHPNKENKDVSPGTYRLVQQLPMLMFLPEFYLHFSIAPGLALWYMIKILKK
jgi:hypothetical protein